MIELALRELGSFYDVVFDHYPDGVKEVEWLDFPNFLSVDLVSYIFSDDERHVSDARPGSDKVTCLGMWLFIQNDGGFHAVYPAFAATDRLGQ